MLTKPDVLIPFCTFATGRESTREGKESKDEQTKQPIRTGIAEMSVVLAN